MYDMHDVKGQNNFEQSCDYYNFKCNHKNSKYYLTHIYWSSTSNLFEV